MKKFNLASAATAVSILMGASFSPQVVQASDISASVAVSNMYLWRGQNISTPSPQVSGSLDYSKNGLYAGIWGSSEGPFDASSETDLYVGYSGSVGDFGYDISYFKYLYPEAQVTGAVSSSNSVTDLSDVIVGLSYGPATFTVYQGVESQSTKDTYYTLSAGVDKFTFLYGKYESKNSAEGQDYSHVQVSFAFNDEVTFTLSKASDDGYGKGSASRSTVFEEDPLFQVSYSKSFDFK